MHRATLGHQQEATPAPSSPRHGLLGHHSGTLAALCEHTDGNAKPIITVLTTAWRLPLVPVSRRRKWSSTHATLRY